MVILPEAGTGITIPSDRTFKNVSTIHTVNRLDVSFLLIWVCRTDIEKWVVNESERMSIVLLANT